MNLLEKLNEIEYFADAYISELDKNKSYNLEEADVYIEINGQNYLAENLIFDKNSREWHVLNEGFSWEWSNLTLVDKCYITDYIYQELTNV